MWNKKDFMQDRHKEESDTMHNEESHESDENLFPRFGRLPV